MRLLLLKNWPISGPDEAGIDIYACEDKPMGNPDPKVNRMYPISGGVIRVRL